MLPPVRYELSQLTEVMHIDCLTRWCKLAGSHHSGHQQLLWQGLLLQLLLLPSRLLLLLQLVRQGLLAALLPFASSSR
jgi:hypothetical protein